MPNAFVISAHYSRMQIQTASPAKAICMLHERCLFLVSSSRTGNSDGRRYLLDKAQNILAQLQAALIISDNTSQSLWYLYDYCYMLLERGTDEDLEHANGIISVLVPAFRDLIRTS